MSVALVFVSLFFVSQSFVPMRCQHQNRRSSTSSSRQPALILESDNYVVRDCLYGELTSVVDIIMSSFYSKTPSPWRQLYRIGELNRLQQSFPYGEPDHRMLVAVNKLSPSSTDTIIGFCDIDDRIPNRPTSYSFNPRPYLSDLCVHPSFRRKGIARSMISACENFCMQELGKKKLFIRVERNNTNAILMYEQLGYQEFLGTTEQETEQPHIVLLTKDLSYQDVFDEDGGGKAFVEPRIKRERREQK